MATADSNELRVNDRIRAREVRLVSAEGEQVGIRALPDALTLARDLDLDLVEVAPQANPPVCRIMDYGKFKYEAAQKAKESRRKTNQISIKEMKYRVKIGKGDFATKTSKVTKFLEEGHKVKITIMFRGREVHHPELGMRILDQVAANNNHLAKVEASPKLDGRNMTMVLAPDKRVQAAAEAVRKKAAADQRQAERLAERQAAAANGTASVVDGGATGPDRQEPPDAGSNIAAGVSAQPEAGQPEAGQPEAGQPEAGQGASDDVDKIMADEAGRD